VEEIVRTVYRHPLRCRLPVHDVDQRALVRSPSYPPVRRERERESIEPGLKRWCEREATGWAFRERRGNTEGGDAVEQPFWEGRGRGALAHNAGGGWHGGQEAAAAIRAESRG
jgi:hypothetical protein